LSSESDELNSKKVYKTNSAGVSNPDASSASTHIGSNASHSFSDESAVFNHSVFTQPNPQFMASQLVSPYTVSPQFISSQLMSPYTVASQFVSPFTGSQLLSTQLRSPHSGSNVSMSSQAMTNSSESNPNVSNASE
jgi:hypothetical protein